MNYCADPNQACCCACLSIGGLLATWCGWLILGLVLAFAAAAIYGTWRVLRHRAATKNTTPNPWKE